MATDSKEVKQAESENLGTTTTVLPLNNGNALEKTLAQEVAANEYQMYLRSQEYIQEIEAEVCF